MKKLVLLLIALASLLATSSAFAAVRVVSTIPDFADIAKSVGGDKVEVSSMVRPTQDPHFVDAKPSFVLDLNQADLLLVAGMELEAGWLPPLLAGARNGKIQRGAPGYLDCSTLIPPMEVQAPDRSQGDIHPGGNPHYWTDPRNGARIARGIAKKLAEVDPANAAAYEAGAQAFVTMLEGRMAAWQKVLAPVKGRKVVVYHDSWVYFLDWAGIVQAGTLEPKPGIPPRADHVAQLIQQTQGQGVKYMIQESFYPTQLSTLFAQKAGAQLLVLPTMTGAGGTHSYVEMVDAIVRALAQ